ncbi:MAG: hypothetical protein P1U46_02620 [Patescibacteria group bacterium]|nr:hypothetical protein [Patescibacteria group bacterium]
MSNICCNILVFIQNFSISSLVNDSKNIIFPFSFMNFSTLSEENHKVVFIKSIIISLICLEHNKVNNFISLKISESLFFSLFIFSKFFNAFSSASLAIKLSFSNKEAISILLFIVHLFIHSNNIFAFEGDIGYFNKSLHSLVT